MLDRISSLRASTGGEGGLLATRTSASAQSVNNLRDCSERRQAEEVLLAERSFSESLFRSMPGAAYVFDQNGKFHRWNRNVNS